MKTTLLLFVAIGLSLQLNAQLLLGHVNSHINFREGPGLNYKVKYTLDQSRLLVILPREARNNFLEVFDIETSSFGFVADYLIEVTDTLNFAQRQMLEPIDTTAAGEVEIELLNQTSKALFVWVNGTSYFVDPYEKKTLVLETTEVTYFSSLPGLFPVFGREPVRKGNTYRWKFLL